MGMGIPMKPMGPRLAIHTNARATHSRDRGSFRRDSRRFRIKIDDEEPAIGDVLTRVEHDTMCGEGIVSRRGRYSENWRKRRIVGRVQMLWESMRGAVLDVFPKAPGLPKDKGNYLMICGGNLQERRLSLAVYRRLFDKEDAPK